ncbi:MAG: Arginine decarboxylase [Pelotomaculum sp. PtaB.Bin104]|nr:MAG: Arginine decarboxylase [Pelotomaculum sp. PtaB.Bin104]
MPIDQNITPLFNAVKKHIEDNIIPFHVPGHKFGVGIPELRDYTGDRILQMDLNGMDDLDYINNPNGAILESEELLAYAYGAGCSFFLVNGSTSGVQAMILSTCKPGSRLILPRNVHKSTIGGLILSGSVPVYVQPEFNTDLGIAMGVSVNSIEKAVKENPDASAVFLINPTYYGVAPDIRALVKAAHAKNMPVLVDEAHGSHMPFNEEFPLSAMAADADMSTISLHKTGGSLTQSSALLVKKTVDYEKVLRTLNITATSSASYLLMCSIDIARKQLAVRGRELLDETLRLARWARNEINKIEGVYAFGRELIGSPGCFDFDETKLGINISGLGYTGYQIETVLRNDYNIQIEMSDLSNILVMVTIGDRKVNLESLINALKDISNKSGDKKPSRKNNRIITIDPEITITPREAFFSLKKTVSLDISIGETAGETIIAYPPGIPIIGLGERITGDIVDYIKILKKENCQLQGASDPSVNYIEVLDK